MKLAVLSKSIRNKKVLLRTDFNVPINPHTKNFGVGGEILDNSRIKDSLPTISFLLKNNNQVIIVTHLGRPDGKRVKNLELKPVVAQLAKLLKLKVKSSPASTRSNPASTNLGERGEKSKINLDGFPVYQISNNLIILENIRFYPEEEKNDKKFAKKLAGLADVFINDALSVCHRAHASTVGVTKFLPSYAGFSLKKEVNLLDKIIKNPKRPLVCIIGGAKIETKLPLIKNFLRIADYILVGGKIGFQKINIKNKKLILPVDGADSSDIGPKTIKLFLEIIKKAKTIFWNGPMGVFEKKEFGQGTKEVASAIAFSKAFSVVGGGETCLALKKFRLLKKISCISSGGGATLEYLAGKTLPGIKVLMR
jgi:phosphoglycerate kinase